MWKMGGSVKCPDDAGPSSHVIIMMTENDCRPVLCNVGIFSCSCSNIHANRDSDVHQYSNVDVEGLRVDPDPQ